MDMFEKIRYYYQKGIYTAEMVHTFVEKGVITEEQYREITQSNEVGV